MPLFLLLYVFSVCCKKASGSGSHSVLNTSQHLAWARMSFVALARWRLRDVLTVQRTTADFEEEQMTLKTCGFTNSGFPHFQNIQESLVDTYHCTTVIIICATCSLNLDYLLCNVKLEVLHCICISNVRMLYCIFEIFL